MGFGFEMELGEGADRLTAWLNETNPDLIACDTLHRYHCDCEYCDGSYPLKANTDSSCSGEIISHVFGHVSQARPVFDALQQGCIETDAVPGMHAGFHVHVGREGRRSRDEGLAFLQFLRFEDVVVDLSTGRFNAPRGMNHSPRENLRFTIEDFNGPWQEPRELLEDRQWVLNPAHERFTLPRALEWANTHDPVNLGFTLLEANNGQDRHSHLATRTRYGTWEFRVFNSTRAAYRMELWCHLALCWSDPNFVEALQRIEPSLEGFVSALAVYDPDAEALAERQLGYMANTDFDALPEMTQV